MDTTTQHSEDEPGGGPNLGFQSELKLETGADFDRVAGLLADPETPTAEISRICDAVLAWGSGEGEGTIEAFNLLWDLGQHPNLEGDALLAVAQIDDTMVAAHPNYPVERWRTALNCEWEIQREALSSPHVADHPEVVTGTLERAEPFDTVAVAVLAENPHLPEASIEAIWQHARNQNFTWDGVLAALESNPATPARLVIAAHYEQSMFGGPGSPEPAGWDPEALRVGADLIRGGWEGSYNELREVVCG